MVRSSNWLIQIRGKGENIRRIRRKSEDNFDYIFVKNNVHKFVCCVRGWEWRNRILMKLSFQYLLRSGIVAKHNTRVCRLYLL